MVWQGSCLTHVMSNGHEEMRWQELCKLVAEERNPQRLSELVDQLIEALDARRDALRSGKQPSEPASGTGPDSGKKQEE
jgi:hypothetical protein